MYKIPTLNAGASDLRLSGDQTQRGTYTQRRRGIMAAAQGGRIGFDEGGWGADESWNEPSYDEPSWSGESYDDTSSSSDTSSSTTNGPQSE